MKLSYTGKPLSERHGKVFRNIPRSKGKRVVARTFSFPTRVLGNALFKRNLVKLNERGALLGEARRLVSLAKHSKFITTIKAPGVETIAPCVFRFFHKGVPVVIKWTGPALQHGGEYALLRHDFLAHQRAVRSGKIDAKSYVLRSPKVYGQIGGFLVLECINNAREQFIRLSDFSSARKDLARNLDFLCKKGTLSFSEITPQVMHVMTTGVEGGKWVFYLPYDYL